MRRLLFRGPQSFELLKWPNDLVRSYGVTGIVREEEETEEEDTGRSTPTESSTNWIKFQVIDEDTNKPVPNVTLNLKLPGGVEKEYTTNSEGKIEINDLQPGTAEILSMKDEEAYEVVEVT
jgi:hypothetical protein